MKINTVPRLRLINGGQQVFAILLSPAYYSSGHWIMPEMQAAQIAKVVRALPRIGKVRGSTPSRGANFLS